MTTYYNEIDPYAAQWLRNLMAAGYIPAGEVDTRSITDVHPDDLRGFRQCHFFAGIGGWAIAARIAGWRDDAELWTGSPPCQPFSVIGKQRGQADDRHLWPHLFRLIGARRPAAFVGEQVAAAAGKDWFDGVFADLDGIGYACGAAVVPACAVNAPHRRDRLWFAAARSGALGDAECARLEGHAGDGDSAAGWAQQDRPAPPAGSGVVGWVVGHDGKARRVEPGIRLLADGVPGRVGKLRAYGNAIVPALGAEVIGALMDTLREAA